MNNIGGPQAAGAWPGIGGFDQWQAHIQNPQLRSVALLLLSKELDDKLQGMNPQQAQGALQQLRNLPLQDLLTLLALMDPEIQKMLSDALGGQTAFNPNGN